MEIPFRDRTDPALRVIETMLWQPGGGVARRDAHLARARATCARLGFGFEAGAVDAALDGFAAAGPARLRLTLGRDGVPDLTHAPFDPASVPARVVVALSEVRLDPGDPFLRIKTTRRALYDAALRHKPADLAEVLFFNSRDELCEGAYTNVFLERADGRCVTPAAICGLLPGVLRASLLDRFAEAVVTRADLRAARRIWIGNALRGLIAADLRPGALPDPRP